DIDWGGDSYFLQIEMDATGGTNYQLMGTSQLLSVPYSLYSESTGNAGATEINELTDGRTLGNSVFLGSGAGINDNGNFNVAVGINALKSNTGGNNTAIGYNALIDNNSGYNNTAIGNNALSYNTSGIENTANGMAALFKNKTGYQNTAKGCMALYSNISGIRNTAIGYYTLFSNTIGNYNTVLGTYAEQLNVEGSNNTIVGYGAGHGATTHNKSGNVFLGYQAGYWETGSDILYIENSSGIPLIWGDFANDTLRINGTLDVNNAFHFPLSDGTNEQVLKTDGNGVLTWNDDIVGAFQINDLSDGRTIGNSVFLGNAAGANDDGTNNRNVAVGDSALNANTSGYNNTANGFQTLYSNTEGYMNTANGYQALFSNTEGDRNTAIGYQALKNDTTGYHNNAIGFQALFYNTIGIYNTANGYQSLRNNTTGDKNTAIGYAANYWNQEGSNNTIIGFQAGLGTGAHNKSGNVFLGYQAGFNDTTDNKLYIENSNSSTPLIYGEFDNDILVVNGSLGVEISSPSEKLEVNGNAKADTMFAEAFSSNSPLLLQTGGTTRIYVDDVTGNVGVGTENPDETAILDLNSNSKGFLPPRMNTYQMIMIPTPAAGLLVFNTDSSDFYGFNGNKWISIWNIGDTIIPFLCGVSSITDGDNNNYNTVEIGSQCWMAENLNTGIMINSPGNQTNNDTIEKYCYNNEPDSCTIYGGLYQWDEIMQYITTEGTPGICPPGWHLPSDAEWCTLLNYVDAGTFLCNTTGLLGIDCGLNLKSASGWPVGSPTDPYGFTALPSGKRIGVFTSLGQSTAFWSSTVYNAQKAWYIDLNMWEDQAYRNKTYKVNGYSVRCIKD
ncbi:MAG: hypothetical protein H8D45_14250, partial [Bacteroidetes bacterium]|nr:hypothetical protein [Bacteroidota bacterium]